MGASALEVKYCIYLFTSNYIYINIYININPASGAKTYVTDVVLIQINRKQN